MPHLYRLSHFCRVLFPWFFAVSALGASPAAAVEDSVFPLIFTDDEGRSVTLGGPLERIVSLNPGNTEILLALDAQDLLFGVDRYSLRTVTSRKIADIGTLLSPSLESIVALEPDVVLLTTMSTQKRGQLDALGLKTATIDPTGLEGLYTTVELLGRATGRREQSQRLRDEMRSRTERIRSKVLGIPPEKRPRVFVEIWPDPLQSAGPRTFIHELIVLAGGTNIAADSVTNWPQFSLETVMERDPDVILTPSAHGVEEIRTGQRSSWRGISAVRQGRVHLVDQDQIARPGPRLIDTLERIARLLHPDLFGEP